MLFNRTLQPKKKSHGNSGKKRFNFRREKKAFDIEGFLLLVLQNSKKLHAFAVFSHRTSKVTFEDERLMSYGTIAEASRIGFTRAHSTDFICHL